MTKREENPSAKVPLAQQAEAAHPVWRSAKPCVWTVRMLTALVKGVEAGKWFRLFDKVFAQRNLLAALQQVAENDGAPGVDHVTLREFSRQLPDSIWELSDRIKTGTYRPQAIRRVLIPKPGSAETCPLGIPTLHPTKTRVVDVCRDGFDFLGYHFRQTRHGIRHWAREKSVRKLKATLRAKTRRTSGNSLQFIIADVNRVLRGWFAYFKHSRPFVFAPLDRWIRQRLRAILRKRRKRRGVAKGWDFHRWPNAFFADQGLYSLATAHVSARQSSGR